MLSFLRTFDRTSFWLGLLAGTIFWLLLNRLRPLLALGLQKLSEYFKAARSGLLQGTEIRHANDTIRSAQSSHLAAPLFSLEEILIFPRLIAPPAPVNPGSPPVVEDIVEQVLPYLPDWPELAATYHGPSLSLAEALSGGVNAIVIGVPGSGKSVALAHLAIQIAHHDPECGPLAEFVPILVHAADLSLSAPELGDPIAPLISAVSAHASRLTLPRMPGMLHAALENGRGLLLLDGLDEFSPAQVTEVVVYLRSLFNKYPRLRLVAAASAQFFDGLLGLGCVPFALAPWNSQQQAAFIQQWGNLWQRYITPPAQENPSQADPLLVNGWLANDPLPLTPLELTLKVWAAYAGDALGGRGVDALVAYLKRMTASVPEAFPAMERIASEMVFTLQPAALRKDVETWIGKFEQPEAQFDFDPTPQNETPAAAKSPHQEISAPRVLPGLMESGLLVARIGNRLSFAHPVLTGYLSAGVFREQDLARPGAIQNLVNQPEWAGKSICLQYVAADSTEASWLFTLMQEQKNDPLLDGLFSVARWLPNASEAASWHAMIMRQLTNTLQKESLAFGLRARALVAMAVSGSSGLAHLFRQALLSPDPCLRQLAALGSGKLRDPKAVFELTRLLADLSPNVKRAACLALVAIGDKASLEAIASALLNGDDQLRRFTAEALANDVGEGHPLLDEGSTIDDLLARRAVVFGLARTRQPWALDRLLKMQAEDKQWVVQNAASQQLELLRQPDAHIPKPLPDLFQAPWLIQFSGEHGMGLGPGKAAEDMLMLVLKDGNPEQIIAALYDLSRRGDDKAVLPVYQVFFHSDDDIREAALNTLWHLKGGGYPLPPPKQFGLLQ